MTRDVELIGRYFKTATDVLRLAVAWSDGDVSLAEATRFRKFKRRERRLLGLLERRHPITEDMLRFKDRWIRLGEILHPSEYKHRYIRREEAFDILRNHKPFTTYNGSVELAFQYNQVWNLIDLLMHVRGICPQIGSVIAIHRTYGVCCTGLWRSRESSIDAGIAASEEPFCPPP